ncbi:MAG: hypothetical protein ACRETD_01895, partial [Steroidobacteraceae bacterium]
AKRERDRMLAREAPQPKGPGRSIDELQQAGREAWLALRAEREAKEREATPEVSREAPERPGPALSLDEQRAQAIEAWRRMREGPSPMPEAGRSKDREQERDRGPELEGPELGD